MFTNKTKSLILSGIVALATTSCADKHNDQGTEFAPNMYHSVGYEPLSQSEGDTNHINPYGMNMRLPVKGTVPRKYYGQAAKTDSIDGDLLEMELVSRNIKSGDMASSEAFLMISFALSSAFTSISEESFLDPSICSTAFFSASFILLRESIIWFVPPEFL